MGEEVEVGDRPSSMTQRRGAEAGLDPVAGSRSTTGSLCGKMLVQWEINLGTASA